ncbi:putative aminotransferase family protein (LolT) [Aspergillus stella-maris]|uniref:putative aminotransferase family protein (LolT) n=1 Tax=Aspergillus stella-maris TaxID=1810926 RepID=UPI003CCD8053
MPSPTPFGNPMKSQFLIGPNYRNLNHGSFGTYPISLLEAQQTLQKSLEAAPDIFIRYTQPPLLDKSRAVLANLLNVPVSDCVLVRNATTGVNTVLHNLAITRELTSNDVVIYFETVYGAVERTLLALRESWGVQLRKVKYAFPLEEGELIARFKAVVEGVKRQGLNPKVAVFETVISNPGIRFPFEEVTALCKKLGILSCIDGAHGVGMINLDLGRLGCDFFTSNCHKWLYTPRSCAVLYVPERNQRFIRTSLPTSWGYIPPTPPPVPAFSTAASSSSNSVGEEGEELLPSVLPDNGKSPFITLFEFTGTTDDSAYSCVPAAMKFRKEVCGGEEKIYSYLEELAGEAGNVVANALGTDILRAVKGGKGGLGCSMVNVRLPIRVSDEDERQKKRDGIVTVRSADVSPLAHYLHEKLIEKGTFVPCFQHGEWFYTRLSAQIYLEKSDFVWLGDVLKEILGGAEGFLGTLKVPRANL